MTPALTTVSSSQHAHPQTLGSPRPAVVERGRERLLPPSKPLLPPTHSASLNDREIVSLSALLLSEGRWPCYSCPPAKKRHDILSDVSAFSHSSELQPAASSCRAHNPVSTPFSASTTQITVYHHSNRNPVR
ncbi:hypothetical protein DPEC_G00166730 [Dallia pectoralis]|uniref:Uncharacterized protein n=1 Tax=Dallia pectoralis TaxID=75939 RepID=A0ACC2GHU5_DALPE|nr:hypothetical protein DPEC_G00166730 [Dallia pectoralis]